MKLFEFINKTSLYLKETEEELIDYLNTRIYNKNICSKDELKSLDELINNVISNVSIGLKSKSKILHKISDLYIMSVSMTDYNIIKSKKFFYYNSMDIIDYLTILLKDCPNIFETNILYKILYKYLEDYADINELINVLYEYKDKIGEDKINEYVDYITKSSFTIICNKILKELDNDIISIDVILKNLDLLSNINLNYHSPKRILLLKEVINKINIKKELDYFVEEDGNKIINKIDNILKNIDRDYNKNEKIKHSIENGNIDIRRTQPYFENINYPQDGYKIVQNEKIITINKNIYNKNAAFCIRKDGDNYLLKVYITDVPTFLANNRQIAMSAYKKGENMYLNDKDKSLLIPMLPLFLIKKNLSLNMYYNKKAIEFSFVIDKNGNVISKNVDKKFFKIGHDLNIEDTKNIINSNEDSLLRYCLRNYYELCKIISLSNNSNINDNTLVNLPLKLVDDCVSKDLNLGIFRDKNKYTKENTGILFSSTPLSKYCCNINLTLFLENNGIHICDEKDLIYIEDHIDDIIKHLNNREEIKDFVSKNYDFCKKYVI